MARDANEVGARGEGPPQGTGGAVALGERTALGVRGERTALGVPGDRTALGMPGDRTARMAQGDHTA